MVAEIMISTSVRQAPVNGLVAAPSRLADFEADGRFRCWSGHTARSSFDIASNDHPMDLVKITAYRQLGESSALNEAHLAMSVGIQFPRGCIEDIHDGRRGRMCTLWRHWRAIRYAEKLPGIPSANEIRSEIGLAPLENGDG